MVQKDLSISVVIPVWNEEQNVRLLVERLNTSFEKHGITYELIFVDDHSHDKTREKLRNLAIMFPIILHTKVGKKGKAQSLLEGFKYAQYPLVAMIDGDLQYPPEAISYMAEEINDEVDIVVAKRSKQEVSSLRKITSQMYLLFFGKILHGFDCDVQSGLKVFKKDIIERITLSPSPWTFDLEFLIHARNAGYKIKSFDIVFEKRNFGASKINIIKASFEIGLSALRLKFLKPKIIPFHPNEIDKKGYGFHYKGAEFINHSKLSHNQSGFYLISSTQKYVIIVLLAVIISALLLNWHITVVSLIAIITFMYFSDLLFNLFLILRGFTKAPEIKVSEADIQQLKSQSLPIYTIFCPLYKEAQVLPQFVSAISRLDYPKDKLQVLIVLEEDDMQTIEKVKEFALPYYFEVLIVPDSLPKTKPKALNFALHYAKGEYLVVYDAEDIPDPDQLKKAIISFQKADKKTICIQAKLNFYNPNQNIITRVFTAEYSLWFDLVLTGLQSIQAPIPLGGTSNHLKTSYVKNLNGWDAFNVTEDCDLGMRLAKQGFKTQIVDSTTLEEANSHLLNWFWQRTRWIKGYMQTYLVHMRNPQAFMKGNNNFDLFTFQLIVGGKIISMFINPFMWITTVTYFIWRSQVASFIEPFFPGIILYMGVFSLVFGNFLYTYYYMIGCAKREQYDLIKYVFFVPFYWIAMSVAAWVSAYKLIREPHYWPKTVHGLHLNNKNAILESTQTVGHQLVDETLIFPSSAVFSRSIQQQNADQEKKNGKKYLKTKLRKTDIVRQTRFQAPYVFATTEEIN